MDRTQAAAPLWQGIAAWGNEQLQTARNELEIAGIPAEETARLRGRIQAFRELLELAERVPDGGAVVSAVY